MKTTEKSQVLIAMQSPERFKLREDGWIQDSFLGIDIGPSSKEIMNFADALKYCQEKGGRLPEIEELYSLVNNSDNNHTYPIFKDNKTDDWYWSGTKTSWNPNAYRCVSFDVGYVFFGVEIDGSYVRPVRSSQDLTA